MVVLKWSEKFRDVSLDSENMPTSFSKNSGTFMPCYPPEIVLHVKRNWNDIIFYCIPQDLLKLMALQMVINLVDVLSLRLYIVKS